MSMSKGAYPENKQSQAMELLREMKRTGMLDSMVQTIQQESQLPVGAMTDGSKRRLSERSVLDDEDFQHVSSSEEMIPSLADLGGPYPTDQQRPVKYQIGVEDQRQPCEVSLPDGVSSLEEWGRTICELPKVKELNSSYRELLNISDGGDTKMASYLNWVRNYKGPSSRTMDFKKYLLACSACESQPKTYFPGSMEIRRLK